MVLHLILKGGELLKNRVVLRDWLVPLSKDIFISHNLFECDGCSRIFGDPLRFNKNKL